MSKEIKISEKLRLSSEQWVAKLASQINGIKGVVISTADGYEIASTEMPASQRSRLSAMASSISALGEVVGKESALGESQFVLIEAEHGYLAVLPVRSEKIALTVGITASRETIAGQVLHLGRQCAQALAKAAE